MKLVSASGCIETFIYLISTIFQMTWIIIGIVALVVIGIIIAHNLRNAQNVDPEDRDFKG